MRGCGRPRRRSGLLLARTARSCTRTPRAALLVETCGSHRPMPGKMYSSTSATTWIPMNGSMPREDLVQRHVRRRHALEVERGHRHRRRQERGLQVERDQQAEEQRIDVELARSSGMKIGMKMTMISVHSSGQPSRKMMTCARIMNWSGVRSSDSTQLLDDLLAAEQRERRREDRRADEQPAHHRRRLRGEERRRPCRIDARAPVARRQPTARPRTCAPDRIAPDAPMKRYAAARASEARRTRRPAAASVGVASPNTIEPSTARISTASGKNDASSILKTRAASNVQMA